MSRARTITADEYAAELVYQVLPAKSLGPDGLIENPSRLGGRSSALPLRR